MLKLNQNPVRINMISKRFHNIINYHNNQTKELNFIGSNLKIKSVAGIIVSLTPSISLELKGLRIFDSHGHRTFLSKESRRAGGCRNGS